MGISAQTKTWFDKLMIEVEGLQLSQKEAYEYYRIHFSEHPDKLITNTRKVTQMNVRPLGTQVLVIQAEAEETTASGIIIPDAAKDKPLRGTIAAIGPEVDTKLLKLGDSVLFGRYVGADLTYDGVDYLVVEFGDLLAVLGD